MYKDLPTVVFAIAALLAGLVALLLPETKDVELVEHIGKIEEIAASGSHTSPRYGHGVNKMQEEQL